MGEVEALGAADEQVLHEESARYARLTGGILSLLLLTVFCEWIFFCFAPGTDPVLATLFIGPLLLVLLTAGWLHRRGHSYQAAWILCIQSWLVTFVATCLLGGLHSEISCGYVVVVMIAAATLGSRIALLFCAMSVLSSTVVGLLQHFDRLPPSIVPSNVWAMWMSLVAVLVTAAVLIHWIMMSLRGALYRAFAASEERDRAHVRYLQAQKMEPVGRLASGVAHDFNNLLTVMTGVSSLLREGIKDPRLVQELLDDLDSATARATLMTGQLLAFTRNRAEEIQVLDLGGLVQSIVPLLARLLGDDVQVDLLIEEPDLRVRADRGQLEQVILNLAVNARDAMPEGGTLRIHLGVDETKERVCVVVEDTGTGIAPELLEKVFTPFFTTKRTGTGLGLATVRDIVTRAGGEISLESQLGRGARFFIRLPLERSVGLSRPSVPIPPEETHAGRILLVEDHDLVRRANRRSLEQAGYDVTAVNDGIEAMSLIEAGGRFDVIVTDMMMPRMNGAELALQLEARGQSTPVLFVSGNFDQLPAQLQELSYPSRFLGKPFSLEVLLQEVMLLQREAKVRLSTTAS